jgi:hypothetical protein
MVSGYTTHGKLTCPYYMENNMAFMLTNDGKKSFFYCHRWFLPADHKYKKDFFVGIVETDVTPPFFWVKNCTTRCQNMVTLCLVFNLISRSFLVLV